MLPGVGEEKQRKIRCCVGSIREATAMRGGGCRALRGNRRCEKLPIGCGDWRRTNLRSTGW